MANPPANSGDVGSTPGSGRSPGEGNGHPFQYSCLENPVDRGAWQAAVHGAAKIQTTEHSHSLYIREPLTEIVHLGQTQ